jgi:hypothetical protein
MDSKSQQFFGRRLAVGHLERAGLGDPRELGRLPLQRPHPGAGAQLPGEVEEGEVGGLVRQHPPVVRDHVEEVVDSGDGELRRGEPAECVSRAVVLGAPPGRAGELRHVGRTHVDREEAHAGAAAATAGSTPASGAAEAQITRHSSGVSAGRWHDRAAGPPYTPAPCSRRGELSATRRMNEYHNRAACSEISLPVCVTVALRVLRITYGTRGHLGSEPQAGTGIAARQPVASSGTVQDDRE